MVAVPFFSLTRLFFSVFVIIGATLVVQPEGLFTSSPEYTEDSTRVAQLGEILSDTGMI